MYQVTICGLPIRCETFDALLQLVRQVAELPGDAPKVKVLPEVEPVVVPHRERRKVPRAKGTAWAVPKGTTISATPSSAKTPVGASVVRAQLLEVLLRAGTAGLTVAELRSKLPKMDRVARSNALHRLKVGGQIKRSGRWWVAVSKAHEEEASA